MPPKPQDKMNKTGDAISASLYDAITSVSSSRVRAVLRDICDACPDAKKMAKNMLLVQKDDNAELFQYNEDEQLNDNGKRECPSHRYEVCERCGFEYDVLIDDDEDDCVWHEGKQVWTIPYWLADLG